MLRFIEWHPMLGSVDDFYAETLEAGIKEIENKCYRTQKSHTFSVYDMSKKKPHIGNVWVEVELKVKSRFAEAWLT